MPFRLRLTYTGLCFFVEDHEKAVHVLLPGTEGVTHTHNGMPMKMERHYARISYDTAHLRSGQSLEDGVLDHRPFENVALDLSTFGNGGVGADPLPAVIPDVVAKTGRKIAVMLRKSMSPNDPNFPDSNNPNHPDEPKRVLSRVTMRGGSITCTEPGCMCHYGSSAVVQITNQLIWVIDDVPAASLTWKFAGLDGGPSLTPAPLYPIPKPDASGPDIPTIDLLIYNLIASELPPAQPGLTPTAYGVPAEHFFHYYRLFKSPASTVLPTYAGAAGGPSCTPTGSGGEDGLSEPGVRPFTCMLAGGHSYP